MGSLQNTHQVILLGCVMTASAKIVDWLINDWQALTNSGLGRNLGLATYQKGLL
jgi:hypothetical protein